MIDDDLLTTPKDHPEHERHRHRYLRLCEDEYDAASLGWIDKDQWKVWHRWLADPHSRSLLEEDLKVVSPDPDTFANVRACLSGTELHEWVSCPAQETAARR